MRVTSADGFVTALRECRPWTALAPVQQTPICRPGSREPRTNSPLDTHHRESISNVFFKPSADWPSADCVLLPSPARVFTPYQLKSSGPTIGRRCEFRRARSEKPMGGNAQHFLIGLLNGEGVVVKERYICQGCGAGWSNRQASSHSAVTACKPSSCTSRLSRSTMCAAP